jgi:CRISPR/Cas system-associated exonuclease Cas4 (RecB family)
MIRPSALNMARKCLHASLLAEKFPESSAYSEEGHEIHKQIAEILYNGGSGNESREARDAANWATKQVDARWKHVEKKLILEDPIAGVVTQGTADLIYPMDSTDNHLVIVDWKSGLADVDHPDDNLQLLAYGEMACIEYLADTYTPVVYKTETGVILTGSDHEAGSHLSEIMKYALATDEERRSPAPGQHCGSCWQRKYCHAWQIRTSEALALIGEKDIEITPEIATKLSERIKAVEGALKSAKDIRDAYVDRGGLCVVNGKRLVIQMRDGRESVDKEKLEKDGLLATYSKKGKPYACPTWVKYKGE